MRLLTFIIIFRTFMPLRVFYGHCSHLHFKD